MVKNIDNGSIYALVNQTRVEAKSDSLRLEAKLDIMQGQITKLRVDEATLNTKVYALVFIISSVISSLATAISLRVFK